MPYEKFVLPQGKHSKGFPLEALQSSELRFTAIFDESAIYETTDPVNQYDINKLMGFSDCNSHHHDNSARFGWNWLDGKLLIHAYVYVDGEVMYQEIGEVPLNEPSEYTLRLLDNAYEFQINDLPIVQMPRKAPCTSGLYYKLFPYFGGDEVAPHDITILVKTHY
jgi:hypothetical protein